MPLRPFELVLVLLTSGVTVTWALGCGPGPEPVVTDCEDGTSPDGRPQVQLGTNLDGTFLALGESSTPLPLQHGAQGGQHVYLSTKLYTGKTGRYRERLFLEDRGRMLGQGSATVDGCEEGWTVSHQITLFVDSATTAGGQVRVEAQEVDLSNGLPVGPKVEASAPIRISR